MTPAVVLAALLALPPWQGDRELSREARAAMLAPVARAVSVAARGPHEAAALVSQGWHESRFASYVLDGRCEDGPPGARCEPDREGAARARGPWQVWDYCTEAWAAPASSQRSLEGGARCVARWMRGARARCPRSGWVGAFSSMRGGARCVAPWARTRVATMRVALAAIWEALDDA